MTSPVVQGPGDRYMYSSGYCTGGSNLSDPTKGSSFHNQEHLSTVNETEREELQSNASLTEGNSREDEKSVCVAASNLKLDHHKPSRQSIETGMNDISSTHAYGVQNSRFMNTPKEDKYLLDHTHQYTRGWKSQIPIMCHGARDKTFKETDMHMYLPDSRIRADSDDSLADDPLEFPNTGNTTETHSDAHRDWSSKSPRGKKETVTRQKPRNHNCASGCPCDRLSHVTCCCCLTESDAARCLALDNNGFLCQQCAHDSRHLHGKGSAAFQRPSLAGQKE